MYTLESQIDFRKLTALHWLRIVFLNRLCSFDANNMKQKGLLSDIVTILGKYGLLNVLEAYKRDSIFPGRLAWKNTIKMKIKEREEYMWHSQTLRPQFERFQRIHSDFDIHFVWFISKSIVQMISSLIGEADSVRLCENCNNGYVNVIDHCISECTYVHLE